MPGPLATAARRACKTRPHLRVDRLLHPDADVSNGCGQDTWSERICLCEAVAGVDFSWFPTSPSVGEAIDFAGRSTPARRPQWTGLDDGTTAGGSPCCTPSPRRATTVTLTVTNGCGQSVVDTRTVHAAYRYYLPMIMGYYHRRGTRLTGSRDPAIRSNRGEKASQRS